jgi:hypothetical protein
MGPLRNSIVTEEPEHRVPGRTSGEILGVWHRLWGTAGVFFLAIFYLATACAAFGAAPAPGTIFRTGLKMPESALRKQRILIPPFVGSNPGAPATD